MKENVLCKLNNREQEANIPECILVIRQPDAAVTNNLLVACQRISKYQPIVDLHMFEVSWKYQSESDGFNLSKNTQSLIMQSCCLPSQSLKYLMHKLCECNKLHKIDLLGTGLQGVPSLTLSNKRSLTHLDLGETNMSAELCKSICQQLRYITHMEHLNMSNNDLSQVSKFTLSNKKTLKYLNLENTHMSVTLYYSICQQLRYITHMEHLNMSNNDLSQVSKFTLSNKKTLKYLNLENTHMSVTLYYSICQQLTDLESLKQLFVSREDSCYKICKDAFLECFLSYTHLPPHVCRRVLRRRVLPVSYQILIPVYLN